MGCECLPAQEVDLRHLEPEPFLAVIFVQHVTASRHDDTLLCGVN